MSATIDLNIVSRESIGIKYMIEFLTSEFGFDLKINNIEVMDNWEYENVIDGLEINVVQQYIEEGKIANIELLESNKNRIGFQIEKTRGGYETDIWIDTANLSYLDYDYIDDENKFFYKKIINVVSELVKKFKIIVATIGIETVFEYNSNLAKMINDSKNIIVWIIVGDYPQCMENYSLTENKQLDIGIFIKNKS